MPQTRARNILVLILVAVVFSAIAWPADAAWQGATPARPSAQPTGLPPGTPGGGPQVIIAEDQFASETREKLEALLERYPPSVGRVLKLDHSLLGNQTYLAPYPALAAFLAQHPEVARNPVYFLANIRSASDTYTPPDRQAMTIGMWQRMMQGLVMLLVFIIVTATLAWLVKSLIDYRRWHRLSKVQAEVHTKVLDRFTANEDLLAFIQTPAGRRFLESAPMPLDPSASTFGGPLRRILWAVEAGLVLAAGGIGLLFVSNRVTVEVSEPLYVVGVLSVSLGVGFVVSSVVSFVLSKRLGLFERVRPVDGNRTAPSGV